MSTTATTTAPQTIDIKTSSDTYRVYAKVDEETGKITDVKYTTAGKNNSAWDKLEELDPATGKPKSGYTLVLEQSVLSYRAATWAGAEQLVEDEEERVAIWNRGALAKQNSKLGAKLTELNDAGTDLVFEPVEGALDLLEALNEVTQRRYSSPADKAAQQLKLVARAMNPTATEDEIKTIVHNLLAQLQR